MSSDFQFKADDIVKQGLTNWNLINEIQQWMSSNYFPKISSELIVLFLIGSENNIKNTQYTIEIHYYCKKVGPELFNNRNIDSPELLTCLETLSVGVIPNTNNKGHGVAFIKIEDSSFFKFDVLSCCKIAAMVSDLQLYENPPTSYEIVVDIEKFSFTLLVKMKIGILRKLIKYGQDGFPSQIKAFHVLNCSPVFEKLMAIVKHYIKKEILNIIKTYPPNISIEELIKNDLPMNCVPSDYGGALGPLKELTELTIEKLRRMKPIFEAEENLRKEYNF